jgi:hypothetical protein
MARYSSTGTQDWTNDRLWRNGVIPACGKSALFPNLSVRKFELMHYPQRRRPELSADGFQRLRETPRAPFP